MRRPKALALMLCTCVLFSVLAGCGAQVPAASPTVAKPVTVQLAWVHTIEYSGLYMAQEQGDYAAEQLDVTLQPLGERAPIDSVLAGEAQFGFSSADLLLLARAAGKPVVAIATIYQRSPVAFISLADRQITRPQDLIDKTVVVDLTGTTAIVYRALLASQGIDPAQINTQPREDYSNAALLSGSADVMDAFINNQPVQLAREGHAVNSILASDYGIDLYANVLFTTEELIETQPELVAGFVRGTVRGMQRAVDDVEQATALAVARGEQLDPEAEAESMQLALPLMNPAGSKPGMMSAEVWQQAYTMLRDQKLLSVELNIADAYNLTFLQQAYAASTGTLQLGKLSAAVNRI